MRKFIPLLVLAGLLVAIVGCNGSPVTPDTNVPTLPATQPPATAEHATSVPQTPGGSTETGCRVAPPIGQAVDGLPPVTADDWIRGPEDGTITLIEYADFQ